MELLMDINKIKDGIDKSALEVNKTRDIDVNSIPQKNEFDKIINKVIDQASDYIIKSVPYGQNVKDILMDVKNVIKTRDAKQIFSTAVGSSIREGLEVIGSPVSVIKDIVKLKDVAFKGGLKQCLIAGIDIVSSKYLKGNLLATTGKLLFDKLKIFINSTEFIKKINSLIDKLLNKVGRFKDECQKWYSAYEKFDLESMNQISSKLSKDVKKVQMDGACIKEGKIIENMTNLVNTKKDKLSKIQLQMCCEL